MRAKGQALDVPHLLGMGVSKENIVPVDWDRERAEECADRWKIPVLCGDAVECGSEIGMATSIYLDFCGPACSLVERTTIRVSAQMNTTATLGVTLLASRESSYTWGEKNPWWRGRWLEDKLGSGFHMRTRVRYKGDVSPFEVYVFGRDRKATQTFDLRGHK